MMANPMRAAARKIALPTEVKSVRTSEILPLSQTNRPVWADWSTERAITDGYKASSWVYACVFTLAKLTSSVPWTALVGKGDEAEEDKEHPVAQLMREPNPYMDGNDLIERQVIHLLLGGNGIWTKVRSGATPVELWPIPPDKIRPVPSRPDYLSHYEVTEGSIKRLVEPQDIVHAMFIDPSTTYWGLAPLQALAKTVDTDVEAVTWNKIALQNRAVTDGVFSSKEVLTREQWELARTQVREQHQGSSNARAPWVLGGGATWQQMSLSPAEMDFIESRRMTREEICAVYGVPPPMVGILDHANYNNSQTMQRTLWVNRVIPLLDDLAAVYNRAIARDFGDGVRLVYDLSNVDALQDNFNDKAITAKTFFDMGVPFNEINRKLELGFDEVPGGDIGYLPVNLLPADLSALGAGSQPIDALPAGDEAHALPAPSVKATRALDTEEQKAAYWQSVERRRSVWYSKVTQLSGDVFDSERDVALSALRNDGPNAVEGAVRRHAGAWETMLRAVYTAVVEDFGDLTDEELAKDAGRPLTKEFDPFDAAVQAWIRLYAAKRADLIAQTSATAAQEVIAEGLTNNWTVDQISDELQAHYVTMSTSRAFRIARTEVVGASNFGAFSAAKQSGVAVTKTWISSRDERVRPDHADADGQEVPMDVAFSVGGESLMYPGDPSASADQTNYCRCAQAFSTRQT